MIIFIDKYFEQAEKLIKLIQSDISLNISIKKYNNKLDTLTLIKNNITPEDKIAIIDEDGIIPFMYLVKQKNIIAATLYDERTAHVTAYHNKPNVVCLGYKITGVNLMSRILKSYFEQPFEGAQRHIARIDMLSKEVEDA